MKSIFAGVLILVIFLYGCDKVEKNFVSAEVKYISLEGGFYGIETDDGENLDPIKLSEEFKVDGLKVYLTYKVLDDQVSFHMWGRIVEIIEIKKL